MESYLCSVLVLLIYLVKECHGDSYTVTGLVASSICAIALFIIVIIVAVFFAVWADYLRKYYKKRGIQKSPRIKYIKQRPRSIKGTMSKEQERQMQLQAQQKLRPKLPNTWRGAATEQPPPQQQNGDLSGHFGTYTTTGDFHFGTEDLAEDQYATVQKSPVVMEMKEDMGPHSVRNYESVMNLPEESPERPANRTSQRNQLELINPSEMVEIPLQQDEKSTHF
ncbi:uncharacterized protein LOC134243299 [Saccostrea cucullata]|uniref:uncharacterized protein LOC134243299 n=1 Tax=Saccostrea cuccullata TaxID=36930 RepID=UPI002ECFAE23